MGCTGCKYNGMANTYQYHLDNLNWCYHPTHPKGAIVRTPGYCVERKRAKAAGN